MDNQISRQVAMPHFIRSKTILNKTKRRDPWFLDDYTVNPYSGCSFNCLFCYIRGSKYGEHMERKIGIKENAVELLDRQLFNRAKKSQFGFIVMSSATDPYLQVEKDTQLTRELLRVILKHRFPVHVITRSELVTRDFDLLEEINEMALLPTDLASKMNEGVLITFSFSTLDDKVASTFEPGATPPKLRLAALHKTSSGGFKTGVAMMPLLPGISDTNEVMESMLHNFKKAGAKYIFPASLTLFGYGPSDSRTLVFRAIKNHYEYLMPRYEEIFRLGSRPIREYQKDVDQRARKLCNQAGLKQSIL